MPAATSASEAHRAALPHRSRPAALWPRWLLYLGVLLSVEACLRWSGADLGKLFDASGLANAGDILSGLHHPDLSADFLERVLALLSKAC